VSVDRARTSDAVSVGTGSTVVLSARTDRAEVTLVNDSTNVIYMMCSTNGLPPTAVAGRGVRLNANGGSWFSDVYAGPIAAIAVGGASNMTIAEL
jgi:hypothetical protein